MKSYSEIINDDTRIFEAIITEKYFHKNCKIYKKMLMKSWIHIVILLKILFL